MLKAISKEGSVFSQTSDNLLVKVFCKNLQSQYGIPILQLVDSVNICNLLWLSTGSQLVIWTNKNLNKHFFLILSLRVST